MSHAVRTTLLLALVVAPASAVALSVHGTLFAATETDGVLDLGTVAVGLPITTPVEITADGADVEVQSVSTLAVDSAPVFYDLEAWVDLFGTAPEGAENADAVLGPQKVVVEAGATFAWPLVVHAATPGWYRGEVTFAHDGRFGVTVQQVRVHVAAPELTGFPRRLDVGDVAVGTSGEAILQVQNPSDLAVVVALQEADAHLEPFQPDGLVVGPGGTGTLGVRYTPSDDLPFSATAALMQGDVVVATLQVVANDCTRGSGAYDRDRDGFTTCGGDCDDDDAWVHPGLPDPENGRDDDCDGAVDATLDAGSTVDDDADGVSEADGDCDDHDAAVRPDATELANGRDDDCDGVTDEGTVNADDDDDGFAEVDGDCDDEAADVSPVAVEVADGDDDDCDALVDEGLDDVDRDGVTVDDGDCDDAQGWSRPGLSEVRDGLDNDCNGVVDDLPALLDDDLDGEGCGCATGGATTGLPALLLALTLRRRRR